MKWPGSRIAVVVAAVLLVAGGAALWALYQPAPPRVEAPDPAPRQSAEMLAAPPQPAGRVIRVECRQGACQFARIVEVVPVVPGADGELRRLTYRPGSAMDDGSDAAARDGPGIDWEASDRQDYAYCSTSRPAFAFPDPAADEDGALVVHHLDLFNLGGYQTASAKLYGLTCHDLPIEAAAGQAFRDLGYRPGTRNEQARVSSPEELLHP